MCKSDIIYHLILGNFQSTKNDIPVVKELPDIKKWKRMGHKFAEGYKIDVYKRIKEQKEEKCEAKQNS